MLCRYCLIGLAPTGESAINKKQKIVYPRRMGDKYFYFNEAFRRPADYVVPTDEQLSSDTQHPDLINSRHFLHKAYNNPTEPKDFLPVFSHIETMQGLFTVATNHYTSPIFHGNIIGATDFETITKRDFESACFYKGGTNHITGLKYLDAQSVSLHL